MFSYPNEFDIESIDIGAMTPAQLYVFKKRMIERGRIERAQALRAMFRGALNWLRGFRKRPVGCRSGDAAETGARGRRLALKTADNTGIPA